MKKFLSLLVISTLLIVSCGDDDDNTTNSTAANIEGTWILTSLNAMPATDLNSDGTASVDMMSETNCFDTTMVTYNPNGTFTSVVSTLEFDANGMIVNCSTLTNTGTYTLNGNNLSVTVNVSGGTVTENTTITQNGTGPGSTYSITATDTEVDAYVSDPGNTVASNITSVMAIFTKQ